LKKKRACRIILNESMATNDAVTGMGKILALLSNEEELIIKPFQPGKIRLLFKMINIICFYS
jgi:hypothetical protein